MRNVTFFFMLGFLVYYWFPFPPAIWRIGLVAICIVGFIIHLREFKFTPLETAMLGFVTVNVLYFFTSFTWQVPEFTNFGNVLCATLPMFSFYVLSTHGAITQRAITLFLVLSVILGFFYFTHAEYEKMQMLRHGGLGDFTINASTIFLVIIPLLFFLKDRWMILCIMSVIVFFVFSSAKRGNIVSMVIPAYLLFRMNVRWKRSFINKTIMVIGFIIIVALAYQIIIRSDYIMNRIKKTLEGDSSGRDIIYKTAFITWYKAKYLYNFILGYGTDATRKLVGIRAHNDWLEILVDFGLVGFCFYFFFFVSLVKVIWQNKNDPQAFHVLLAVFYIWFSKSLYSMGFTENLFSYLSMVIGIVLGKKKEQSQLQNQNIENWHD